MKTLTRDTTALADAVAELIENLHQNYPGIKTKTVPPIEDEDLAVKIEIPSTLVLEDVEVWIQRECISLEDKYNVYLLPLVFQMQ